MDYLRIEERNQVGFVIIDDPNDAVNKLHDKVLKELILLLDEFEQNSKCLALVIMSGKPNSFIVGADLDMLLSLRASLSAAQQSQRGHRLLNRIANLNKPVVAAIHGSTIGGGLEVALACHYRLATDHPDTVFSLPEVKLGLLPSAGGTQRLPRLIGLQAALDMMLLGKPVSIQEAKRLGLVDLAVHPFQLQKVAGIFARDRIYTPFERTQKWSFAHRFFNSSPVGRNLVFRMAYKNILTKMADNYPAPFKILKCVKVGLKSGMAAGLNAEAKYFEYLMNTPQSHNLIQVFFSRTASKTDVDQSQARPVNHLGILGVGPIGTGITEISANRGINCFLHDVDEAAVIHGEKAIWDGLEKQVEKGLKTSFERDRFLARIYGVTNYRDLKNVDMILEAVVEDLEVKQKVLHEVEAACSDSCIFASNTSSLLISDIAKASKRPGQVLGMHYLSPVPKMPLLEIVVTAQTEDWVKASAIQLGLRQGKQILVVGDNPGFYTGRILARLLDEAIRLLEEGAAIEAIDEAMFRFGFPIGPIALLNKVGTDLIARILFALQGLFHKRAFSPVKSLDTLVQAGFKGKKSDRGFFRFDLKKTRVNTEIYDFFGGPSRHAFKESEIQERLTMALVNEAAFCLQERVLANPKDGDLGAILGVGFPPFLGGPFRYLDNRGVSAVLIQLERLTDCFGPRFKAADIFKDFLNKPFYP